MGINRNKVLAAAQKFVHRGNLDKAIDQYQLLVDDDPSDARSLLKIADLHAKLNERDKALKAYSRVAQIYARDEFHEKAAAVYTQALRLDPEAAELHRGLGDAYHHIGRLRDAVRAYHKAQKIYKARGDAPNQRDLLERMVALDADDIGMRIQLAERYAKDEMNEHAVELFEFCADKLDAEGRLDEFVQVAERIIFLKPEAPALRRRVLDIYLSRGDHRSALGHLQVCFKRDPQDVEILELLAQTFLQLERVDKALLVLQELANQYQSLVRDDAAERTYERILGIDPDNARAQARLRSIRRRTSSAAMTAVSHTGSHKPRIDTPTRPPTYVAPEPEDALAGIEFLDENSELQLEVHAHPAALGPAHAHAPAQPPTSAQPPTPEQRPPHTPTPRPPIGAPPRTAAQPPPLLEAVDPTVEHSVDVGDDAVKQVLKETDVFIKYGLYDKAYETIVGVIAQHPDSLAARAQMARLQHIRENSQGAAAEFMEMARITRANPDQCAQFLTRALALSDDPAGVHSQADAWGVAALLPPAAPPAGLQPHTEPASLDTELSDAEADLFLLDDEDDADLMDLAHTNRLSAADVAPYSFGAAAAHAVADPGTQELDLGDVDLLLAGPGAAPAAHAAPPQPAAHERTDAHPMSDALTNDIVLDDLSEDVFPVDLDDDGPEIADFEMKDFGVAEMGGAQVDELNFDEATFAGAELVEMDLDVDGLGELSDAQINLLDAPPPVGGQPAPSFDLSEEEADQMFDELFADFSADDDASPGANINLGADDPQGDLAEVDFFLQQGLLSAADESLARLKDANPAHPGIEKRTGQLNLARQGLEISDNPFGARSLSKKFVPAAEFDESHNVGLGLANAHNTSLELGLAYRDMGLYDEAILEFTQALDDPDAAAAAHFHIAHCELEKGAPAAAAQRLQTLLQTPDVPDAIRNAARRQLEAIE